MAEREGARASAAEAEAHRESSPAEGTSREARSVEETVVAPRTTDAERTRASAEAAADAGTAVSVRDRTVSAAKRTGRAVKRGVRAVAGGAGKAASASGGWLAGEMESDWNRTALGFGERMRKFANVVGNAVFNPLIRMGAAIEDWGAGYPPFSWFKKKADTTEALEDLLPDYGKGEGKKSGR